MTDTTLPEVATLRVTRIAETSISTGLVAATAEALDEWMEADGAATDPEHVLEFAGRACYQSFHKPNQATERNADYLAHITASGHLSVLEHASVSWYVEGVSRSCSLEMARHRHTSRSELSQRFVAMDTARVVIPPALRGDVKSTDLLRIATDVGLACYDHLVKIGPDRGLTRKQAREAARAVLPSCIETKMVLTCNLRSAREWIERCIQPDADAEIRELAAAILRDLLDYAPSVFADMAHYLDEEAA